MTIDITQENDTYTVVLVGRLDPVNSQLLQEKLNPILQNAKKLILEVSRLEYISSSGIRVVLAAYRALNDNGDKLVVLHPTESVARVLHITRLDAFLTIEA